MNLNYEEIQLTVSPSLNYIHRTIKKEKATKKVGEAVGDSPQWNAGNVTGIPCVFSNPTKIPGEGEV